MTDSTLVNNEENVNGSVSIIPLGGLGEFGLNIMVYETEDDLIVIDTGFMLPNSDMPGVDLIFPDIHYLVERQEKIRGILLTHGHEDHIGALAYVLRQLDVPVYGTQLTLAIASGRGFANTVSSVRHNSIRLPPAIQLNWAILPLNSSMSRTAFQIA